MSLSAKNDPDHNLNTLTDVVRLLGDTRQDVKKLASKVDANQQENRERFDRQDREMADMKNDMIDMKNDMIDMKKMLKLILSKLPD